MLLLASQLSPFEAHKACPGLALSGDHKGLYLTDQNGRRWLWLSRAAAEAVAANKELDPVYRYRAHDFADWLKSFANGRPAVSPPLLADYFAAPRLITTAPNKHEQSSQWLAEQIRQGQLVVRPAALAAVQPKPSRRSRYIKDVVPTQDELAANSKTYAQLDAAAGIRVAPSSAAEIEPPADKTAVDADLIADDGAPDASPHAPRPGDKTTQASGVDGAGNATPPANKACLGGEPVNLATGEEILQLIDFTLPGTVPLAWVRTYRSSASDRDHGLGYGWSHPLGEQLERGAETIHLLDSEGRRIPFPLPEIGGRSHNEAERLSLLREDSERYSLASMDGGAVRIFSPVAGLLRLTRIEDSCGNRLRLHYVGGRLSAVENDSGDGLEFELDAAGRINAIRQRLKAGGARLLMNYAYDDAGDLVAATDAEGDKERYAYTNHLFRRRTLKSGYSFHFEWDQLTPAGRCMRQWGDPIDGQRTYAYRFDYDSQQRITTVTDTRGAVHVYQFNDRGQVLSHRDAEGGEWRQTYDAAGRLLARRDPIGHTEHFEYDEHGRLRRHLDRAGHAHSFTYDNDGRPTSYRDPEGGLWQRRYNRRGLLESVCDPLGHTTEYRYNALGLIGRVTAADGAATRYFWDAQGRLEAVRDPLGRTLRYRYNTQGQLRAIGGGPGQLQYRYDGLGRITSVHTPDGGATFYAYNPLGLVASITDPAGRTTRYRYDGLSQIRERIDPLGNTLRYHYDGERNLIGLTNEAGERYHLAYDHNERLIEEIGFDGRTTRYRYDGAGHLIERLAIMRDGENARILQQTRYTRDPLGRLLSADNGAERTSYRYDALGRPVEAANSHRCLAWRYDPAGRLLEDWQDGMRLQHAYDAVGRRTHTVLPGGEALDYRFDPIGQLESVRYNGQTLIRIKRDASGREMARRFGNQVETAQLYDPQGRLVAQKTVKRPDPWAGDNLQRFLLAEIFEHKPPVEREINQRLYYYNSAGQLARIDDTRRGQTRYHYDPLDRLLQVQGPLPETLIHDPAHNLLAAAADEVSAQQQAQRTAAQGNRLAVFGDARYDYDAHGNRTESRSGKDGALTTTYRYDADNQLIEVSTPQDTVTFAYDPLGRRIEKTSGAGATRFLWNGDVLLQEQFTPADDAPGAASSTTYLFEPNSFKPLALLKDGQPYYYHLDHLGTPLELTDARGELVWVGSYKSYGNLALQHAAQIPQPLRFQGQYCDDETGLHYNRFRYYDPDCGRFIHQDPIGLLGGTNNYQYVPNPTGWVDPLGLTAVKEDPARAAKALTIPQHYVFHATTNVGATRGVLSGIDPRFLNPSSRFGAAFYIASSPNTALAELAHHGAAPTHGIRFALDESKLNMLDLTDPTTAAAWGYSGGPISSATQTIGADAQAAGYNAIKYPSLRGAGANYAILDDFNDIVTPMGVAPVDP